MSVVGGPDQWKHQKIGFVHSWPARPHFYHHCHHNHHHHHQHHRPNFCHHDERVIISIIIITFTTINKINFCLAIWPRKGQRETERTHLDLSSLSQSMMIATSLNVLCWPSSPMYWVQQLMPEVHTSCNSFVSSLQVCRCVTDIWGSLSLRCRKCVPPSVMSPLKSFV